MKQINYPPTMEATRVLREVIGVILGSFCIAWVAHLAVMIWQGLK